jgi:hypothetical protein
MTIDLLKDWRLLFICLLAGLVTLLTLNTSASRPAAVRTGRVAMSVTIYNIFFLLTRFANLFYAPFLANYVDRAIETGDIHRLEMQFRLILMGSAGGGLLAMLLLPTLIEIYVKGIQSLDRHGGSMKGAILEAARPKNWPALLGCLRPPGLLHVNPLKPEGVPMGFIVMNVFATAIWTVGVLCAMFVSAKEPEYARTSVLLSGMVNSIAATIFSIFVDPKAALVTDQVIAGSRPESHVRIIAVWLMISNFIGTLLAQLFFLPGVYIIQKFGLMLIKAIYGIGGGLILILIFQMLMEMLATTSPTARVAAVHTRRVASAFAIYSFFFLFTRMTQQVYAPLVGTIVDINAKAGRLDLLEQQLRLIILSATAGIAIGWMLMPTFLEIYAKAIRGLDREGSLQRLILASLHPKAWPAWISCLRLPSTLGVKFSHLKEIPTGFLYSNVIVIAIYTIGVMAATYASALHPAVARTAALLSNIVNGVATILISLVVDPRIATITDQAVADERPRHHATVMAVFLIASMFLGTLLSQAIFIPAAHLIGWVAELIRKIFGS